MKNFVVTPWCTAIFLAAMLVGSAPAWAAATASGDKPEASAKKKKTGASGQVKFLPDSAESASERSSRLKREGRGPVTAGAGAGYTR